MIAGVHFEVVGVFAFASLWTVILIVEFFASAFVGLGSSDLAPDMVGEVAVHAVLAVAGEEVDAGILIAFNMDAPIFAPLLCGILHAFLNCEVLVRTEVLNKVKLILQLPILYEIFVVHSTVPIIILFTPYLFNFNSCSLDTACFPICKFGPSFNFAR